ncbi:probable LRR receptor-like serine/threonine-protein kinase At1g51880 [Neltuma alba]|uniref:probable LRR receptor-like serine/threonine-protein kinase At1g51880 n=1 Tax=Neltuma alba TaxID=207710 RepID=UPI0010A2B4E2|nr:probable LRR receptor-like serine/threonine-protein kinase At1g51880 [Prosopis alba]
MTSRTLENSREAEREMAEVEGLPQEGISPPNILLNNFMVAKIADFGLSRAFINERDSHLSTQPAGMSDYIDPEFQKSGIINKKCDICSFGMILLQLITGRPPIRREIGSICYIIDWVRSKVECGDIHGIVDPRLEGEFHVATAWKIGEIAMSCVIPKTKQTPDTVFV